MRNYRSIITGLFVSIFLLSLGGCQPVAQPTGAQELRLPLASFPASLDPLEVDPSNAEHVRLLALLYNGLVRYDPNGEIIPDLAQSYTIAPAGNVFTFYLRQTAYFHHGQPVTANDVVYSMQRILKSDRHAWILADVSSAVDSSRADSVHYAIRPLDEFTVEFTLSAPNFLFPKRLALPSAFIVPALSAADSLMRSHETFVGSGPFIMRKKVTNREIILKKFTAYFDQQPVITQIRYNYQPNPDQLVQDFNNGLFSFIQLPQSTQISPEYEIDSFHPVEHFDLAGIVLNCAKPPLDRVEVRQALNLAINRSALVDAIMPGRAVIARGPIPPASNDYNRAISGYDYDPEMARNLLTRAGFANGFELEIWQYTDDSQHQITNWIKADLEKIGVRVKLIQNEPSLLTNAIRRGEIDSFYRYWRFDYLPIETVLTTLFCTSTNTLNNLNYSNAEVDRWLSLSRNYSDPIQQRALYQVAEEAIVADAPWIFLFHARSLWLKQASIRGLTVEKFMYPQKMVDVWVEN